MHKALMDSQQHGQYMQSQPRQLPGSRSLLLTTFLLPLCLHQWAWSNWTDLIVGAFWDVSALPEALDADVAEAGAGRVGVQALP